MINKSKIVKDAQKFITKGQLDKAIVEYKKILAETPNDSNTHNTIGDLYLKRGEKENAVDSYKKAAEVLNKDGFTLKAIALYKKVLNLNPDQVDVLLLMGKLNAERGMLGSANEYYLSVASYFGKQGNRAKTLEIYKTLCDLNPDNLSLAAKLAELYQAEGFDREAVSKYIDLAEKKIQSDELRDARDFLEKAAPKGGERFDFIRVSALLDIKENRLPEATRKLEDVRALDPNDTRIATLLSETYQRSGRYEDASEILRGLMDSDPKNPVFRKQLIDIHIKSGDYSSAWKDYHALIEGHITRNEFKDAERLLREFIEHKQDSIEARRILTDVYAKMDRPGDVASVHMEMAAIYRKSGEPDKAANIYRRLLEHDPDNAGLKGLLSETTAPPAPPIVPEPPVLRVEELAPPAPPAVPEPPILELEELAPPAPPIAPEPPVLRMEEPAPPAPPVAPEPPAPGLQELFEQAGKAVAEEEASHEPAYELPETTEGFPSIEDLGSELDISYSEGSEGTNNAFELPEEEAEGLDIFGTAPPGPVEMPEAAAYKPPDRPKSLSERLTEIDAFIRNRLIPKATVALTELNEAYPSNPDVKKKQIELCKIQGDLDGFLDVSMELARIYMDVGMKTEAEKVIRKAQEIAPGDDRLQGQMRIISPPEEYEDVSASTSMMPGSVHYLEELAEADFYAQQGLTDEARKIYRLLLAADPDNEELKAKCNALDGALEKGEAPEIVLSPVEEEGPEILLTPGKPTLTILPKEEVPLDEPVEAVKAPMSMDDELDAAFREMDFGGEEEVREEAKKETSEEIPSEEIPVEISEDGREEVHEEAREESEFFDLAAELKDEIEHDEAGAAAADESFADKDLEMVFKEFKKGVEEQLGKEDYETHYNLGIAYKEMGMLDEAVSEFTLAGREQSRKLDCASMLGLCYIEKDEYDKAIEQFKVGLSVTGRDKEEYMGLKYDLATAYELSGDMRSARALLNELCGEDAGFRDARERLRNLKDAGEQPEKPEDKPDKAGKNTPPGKKSRVSYL